MISVVIPAYKRSDLLISLLRVLELQTYRNFEVVVIVDGIKETLEAACDYEAGYPLIVKYIKNSGCQIARNEGIKESQGGIIAFTDDDCIPSRDWLGCGMRYFQRDGVVGVEGAIYSDAPFSMAYDTVELTRSDRFVHGRTANMFYRKSVLEKVGGFNPKFSIKSERGVIGFRGDTDLAWRIQKYGEVVWGGDARVYHPIRGISVRRLLSETKLYRNSALLLHNHPDRWRDVLALNFIPSRLLAVPLLPLKAFWFSVGLVKDAHNPNAC
jgi:glycosyltransferase involved in cell wall biosynthesis